MAWQERLWSATHATRLPEEPRHVDVVGLDRKAPGEVAGHLAPIARGDAAGTALEGRRVLLAVPQRSQRCKAQADHARLSHVVDRRNRSRYCCTQRVFHHQERVATDRRGW